MSKYLSKINLQRAAMLSCIITLISIPRFLEAGINLSFYLPVTFLIMILILGAATAWSNTAGMYGLFPERKRMLAGIGIGILMACILIPVYYWLDPIIRNAIIASGDKQAVLLHYPIDLRGRIALILWLAGTESILFHAVAVSYFARLFKNQKFAIIGAVCIRLLVCYLQISVTGISTNIFYFMFISVVTDSIGCILFANTGLLSPMTFSAVLGARHLFM